MQRLRRIGLIIVIMAALVGCGNTETVDPAKLAGEAATAFDAVNTFAFKLDVTEGESAPLGDIILITAEGNSVRPDKVQAKLKAKLKDAPLAVNINGIIIGADAWITPNPFNPTVYEKLEDTGGLENFSPAKGVSDMLRSITNPKFIEEVKINEVTTQHINGTVDATKLNSLTGGAATAGNVQVDVWIGKDDKLVRQIVAVGKLDPSEKDTIKRTLTLSDFNKSVTIAPPN